MMKSAPEEQHFFLSSLSPDLAQRRLALAVVLVLLLALFLFTGPLLGTEPRQIDAFVPAYATAMFVTDSITALLLFAQFAILRLRGLLAIACGYLFAALISISWMLTFPGIFMPALHQSPLLYIIGHVGFPASVIAYALLKDADPVKRLWDGSVHAAIVSSVAGTTAVVGTTTFTLIAVDVRLDVSGFWFYTTGLMVLVNGVALIKLCMIRRRSVLDLWLMVVMCAYLTEVCLTSFPAPIRFSNGWYAARFCGFMSSSLVLFVLLYEITMHYAQLIHAVSAQRREREARLMTGDAVSASIAHEVKQPLSAMVTNAQAGLRLLARSMADEVKAALEDVVADGHRAAAIIDGIRALFKQVTPNTTSLAINDLIKETLAIVRGELTKHRVSVQAELNEQLPWVKGDRVQVQQVLLNLITNAIDSMAAKDGSRVLGVKSGIHDPSGVMVSVADSGTGVDPKDIVQIFTPLFTTKSHGMGMGLPICRSIIEAHGGQLWASSNTPEGAVFHFTLLADGAVSAGPPRGEQLSA